MAGGNQLYVFSVLVIFLICSLTGINAIRYEPNWKSIDSRPLPAWYDESKIGIFIHWGVFSVPSLISEWFWHDWITVKTPRALQFMHDNYKPDWTYQDFAKEFTAELFNPNEWADIFKASGARYVVLTSKHHEGFTNWPSNYSFSWNAMDVGPKKDLVGMLASSIRNKDMHFGLYHSLFEWYNPLYLQDKANNFTTKKFVESKTMPELYEIVNNYKPDIVWSDGDIGPDIYWNSTNFLAWLYNDSPVKDTVVTNDRWGSGIACHHGGYFTCNDRYNPGVLQPRKWENCMTIDKQSWGYRRDAKLSEMLTMQELINTVVETVSCGGNILINVGPTHDGTIIPMFEDRLRSLGAWLGVNGDAIYSSKPWTYQNDTITPHVWYTAKKSMMGGLIVYATVLKWPSIDNFYLASPMPTPSTKVTLLGYPNPIEWKKAEASPGIILIIPTIPFNKMPCDYGWVFKMENLATDTFMESRAVIWRNAISAQLEVQYNRLSIGPGEFAWLVAAVYALIALCLYLHRRRLKRRWWKLT